MWRFVISGNCLPLHVKLEFMNFATCLASNFFESNSGWGGVCGFMANVRISFVKYVQ